jgi:hypothetical protein
MAKELRENKTSTDSSISFPIACRQPSHVPLIDGLTGKVRRVVGATSPVNPALARLIAIHFSYHAFQRTHGAFDCARNLCKATALHPGDFEIQISLL